MRDIIREKWERSFRLPLETPALNARGCARCRVYTRQRAYTANEIVARDHARHARLSGDAILMIFAIRFKRLKTPCYEMSNFRSEMSLKNRNDREKRECTEIRTSSLTCQRNANLLSYLTFARFQFCTLASIYQEREALARQGGQEKALGCVISSSRQKKKRKKGRDGRERRPFR